MFCPNCGKGDQTPESYCRSCGEFLTDFSARFYLVKRLLGGAGPRAQLNFGILINTLTGLASALLLGFLNGHYDALRDRTGEGPPRVIYYVYVFLGLVLLWQFLGLVVNTRLKKKLDGDKKKKKTLPAADTKAVEPPAEPKSLEPGRRDPVGPDSVTQQTTKLLDKLPRK
ncbi:MAG TPA: hypothetical protein VF586_03845 [Pyrinomonadaceae bacterium]|jgi:hypothetical protein